MRSAKIHPINESDHWAEYAELSCQECEPDDLGAVRGAMIATLLAVPIWCAILYFGAHIVRAIIRWPYWSQVLR